MYIVCVNETLFIYLKEKHIKAFHFKSNTQESKIQLDKLHLYGYKKYERILH